MSETRNSPPMLVALAWLLVGIPLAWGVYKSSLNAAKLFKAPPTAVSTQAPATK